MVTVGLDEPDASVSDRRRSTSTSPSALRARIASAVGLSEEQRQEPVGFSVVESEQEDGFVRHLIAYETPDGDRVPAHLAVPNGVGPFPAVAVFHQHNGERHLGKSEVFGLAGDDLQAFGPELARAGCVVLAPDSIAFEDRRRAICGRDPHPGDFEQHYNELAYRLVVGDSLGRKVLSDAGVAVSVLCGLVEVDHARVGAMGHSYGGNIALFLAAVDDRVAFAAASGAACTYRRKMRDGTGIEMAEVIPGFAAHLDVDDLVRAIAPRPPMPP
jgi:dienelactone hydrolase